MFGRLSKDGRLFESQTKDHIKKYAESGQRIMVTAYRELGEEEYRPWEEKFQKAKTSLIADRDISVDELANEVERDLTLLGATAIEDKLQKGVSFENLKFH
jgi:phospholipid-translocating ATPase